MANGVCAAGSRKRKGRGAALEGLETVPVAQLRAAEGAGALGGGAGGRWRNKEKVLMLTSRGIPPRCPNQTGFLQSLRTQPACCSQGTPASEHVVVPSAFVVWHSRN